MCLFFALVSSQHFSFYEALKFLRNTYKTDGLLALWRGNSATMARVIPFAAIQFCSHEQWKHILMVEKDGYTINSEMSWFVQLLIFLPFSKWNPVQRTLAGSLAGVTATTCTYPLDMARARLAVSSKAQ